MQVVDGILLLLSGGAGYAVSDPLDCSAYAVETASGVILFDCGVGRDPADLKRRLAALERPVTDIFLTHAHADHSGGAATAKAVTGAVVHAGHDTAHIVAAADEAAMSLDAAKRAGIYAVDYRFATCRIDRPVADGEPIRCADTIVTPIATPGHSADHFSYLVARGGHRALIAGDALFAGGRVVLQDTPDCSVPDTCASIRRLAGYAFDVFLPGHGPFSATAGSSHVQAAMKRIDRLLVPELFM